MAFWRKASTTDVGGASTNLTASAAHFASGNRWGAMCQGSVDWQDQSWRYYDEVPEFRWVVDWIANSASRARLFITEVDDNGEPIRDGGRVARSATFMGGPAVQGHIIKQSVLHLQVPGDCWVIARVVDDGEMWDVLSIDELTEVGDELQVNDGSATPMVIDKNSTVFIRVRERHPRNRNEANSPARAARYPMKEIVGADQHVQAQINSRLASAGILLVPKELNFHTTAADQADGPGDDGGADTFMSTLTEAMMTAIKDPDSVSSIVPMIIRGPGDHLDKVRLLTLSTPVSEAILQLRDSAIRRLAMGLDISPEQLLGSGDTNHLSSWQMEESLVKTQIIPKLELLCAALTEQYLWPALDLAGVEEHRRFIIWYDVSVLVQRPDRASDAQHVYDRGELSGQALRRENGFPETDAPTAAERRRYELLEVAGKVPVAAPVIVEQLLEAIGLSTDQVIEPAAGPGSQGRTVGVRAPQRSRELPARMAVASGQAALLAAADTLTLQALETAGKRLAGRSRYKLDPLPPSEYHTASGVMMTPVSANRLLEGCFEHVDRVAKTSGVDGPALRNTLHDYASTLLCEGRQHQLQELSYVLDQAQLHPAGK